jgi:hypothetical protein
MVVKLEGLTATLEVAATPVTVAALAETVNHGVALVALVDTQGVAVILTNLHLQVAADRAAIHTQVRLEQVVVEEQVSMVKELRAKDFILRGVVKIVLVVAD